MRGEAGLGVSCFGTLGQCTITTTRILATVVAESSGSRRSSTTTCGRSLRRPRRRHPDFDGSGCGADTDICAGRCGGSASASGGVVAVAIGVENEVVVVFGAAFGSR